MASRVKEDEKNERIIRNLLKIPENRRCINCNSLGPQYVCTNFSTFICTTCSGLHREFTHRVKSVSMAKFTPQEVSALQGGGNASAREIYLKEWDPQRNSLPDGSNIERLRDFIKHVYVNRKYTGETPLEKPPRVKTVETEDLNRRVDSYQGGGSRSPPYEDRPSSGGRSPAYEQDNRHPSDYRRSPARTEVVNDWRREDRFSNGRSPDSQIGSDVSSPPMVRPVRDILGENVSPLRVIEPPKATGRKSAEGSAHTQRTASSSSLASSDGNPPSLVKVEPSFIDFDSVPEPSVTKTDAIPVQITTSSDNNWANFDSAPESKPYTAPSNSVESLLSDLSISVSTSGPTPAPPMVSASPFDSSVPQGSSFGLFGSVAPPSVFPSAGAPAAPPLSTAERSFLTNAPPGGQWNPPFGPNPHGPSGALGQAVAKPAIDTAFGFSTESSLDVKSGGRKELPADLFSFNNSYLPRPVSGWYAGPQYYGGAPMQYNMPMVAPNFQPVSTSTNPFDFSNEPSPVPAPTFPSGAALHGRVANPSSLMRASSLGTPSSHPSYAPPPPPNFFSQQEIPGTVAPRPIGLSGKDPAFISQNPNHQWSGFNPPHSGPNSGGNPFG